MTHKRSGIRISKEQITAYRKQAAHHNLCLTAIHFKYETAWDWRNVAGVNWTVPVEDQGDCGSRAYITILMPQPVMLCALQDLEFRLNGMLLCVDANTSVSQEESWVDIMDRNRNECEKWVQGYCDKMNAFYVGDCDVFPDFVISDESRFTNTDSYIIDAWVKSTCKRNNRCF